MSKPREVLGPGRDAGYGGQTTPDFASNEAAELWHESGKPELGEPSGKNGYTVADVKAAAQEE